MQFNRGFESSKADSLSNAYLGVRMVIRFQSHATGLFAFSKDIKVKKGSICGLRRNRNNIHGKLLAILKRRMARCSERN